MGHSAWGMGHGAWGMGHGAWGIAQTNPKSQLQTPNSQMLNAQLSIPKINWVYSNRAGKVKNEEWRTGNKSRVVGGAVAGTAG
jgi:hypothetical protein